MGSVRKKDQDTQIEHKNKVNSKRRNLRVVVGLVLAEDIARDERVAVLGLPMRGEAA